MASERFLSPSWYRIATLKPRRAAQARLRQHRYRGQPWYVISDDLHGRVHRLSPSAFLFVAGLDGTRTVDALWTELAARLGEQAPSQDDIIQLLGQLHAADLLTGDVPPDAGELFQRQHKQSSRRALQYVLNPLAIRLKLVDPDRFLVATLPALRWLFTRVGAALWLAVVLPAIVLAAQHWPELTGDVGDHVLSAQNLVLMALCYPVVKTLHELGHAYATRVHGGEVHQLGVMLLVLFPVPYMDASAAAGFRGKWRRSLVGAAGMMVELFLAAIALYVWLAVEPGLVRAVAFSVMLMAGVSTIIFNGNPLLRYDGYYILSDLLEIPNLGQRATRYWADLVQRHVFGVPGMRPFNASAGERAWFLVYAPASLVYRLGVTLAIALLLASNHLALGVGLALWGLVTAVVVPVGRAAWHVLTAPQLGRNRGRALASCGAALLALAVLLLWLPAPLHTTTEGIVWLPDSAIARAGTDGFVDHVVASPGAYVHAGDALMTDTDPVLATQVTTLRARIAEISAVLEAQRFTDRIAAALAEAELAEARTDLALAEERQGQLTVRAGSDGVLVVDRPADLPGRFVHQGTVVAWTLPPEGARLLRATVNQDDIDLVRHHLRRIAARLPDRPGEDVELRLLREVPAGQDSVPSRALGASGGGATPVDPRDDKGTHTLGRLFQLDLELPQGVSATGFGARAAVRFDHDWEPLGTQLWRRLRQLLLSRIEE